MLDFKRKATLGTNMSLLFDRLSALLAILHGFPSKIFPPPTARVTPGGSDAEDLITPLGIRASLLRKPQLPLGFALSLLIRVC